MNVVGMTLSRAIEAAMAGDAVASEAVSCVAQREVDQTAKIQGAYAQNLGGLPVRQADDYQGMALALARGPQTPQRRFGDSQHTWVASQREEDRAGFGAPGRATLTSEPQGSSTDDVTTRALTAALPDIKALSGGANQVYPERGNVTQKLDYLVSALARRCLALAQASDHYSVTDDTTRQLSCLNSMWHGVRAIRALQLAKTTSLGGYGLVAWVHVLRVELHFGQAVGANFVGPHFTEMMQAREHVARLATEMAIPIDASNRRSAFNLGTSLIHEYLQAGDSTWTSASNVTQAEFAVSMRELPSGTRFADKDMGLFVQDYPRLTDPSAARRAHATLHRIMKITNHPTLVVRYDVFGVFFGPLVQAFLPKGFDDEGDIAWLATHIERDSDYPARPKTAHLSLLQNVRHDLNIGNLEVALERLEKVKNLTRREDLLGYIYDRVTALIEKIQAYQRTHR